MPSLRPAVPADAPILAGMRYDFRAALGPPSEGRDAFVSRCAQWMAEALASPDWRCWVALDDGGAIRGHLWLEIIPKIPNPVAEREAHAYITNVFLDPVLRGHGLGERLMATAMDWCRAERIDSVILWPTSRSRTLYERHGFAVRDDLMVANLGERHLG
jgi:GNAT superfamily N-acetyltransferase